MKRRVSEHGQEGRTESVTNYNMQSAASHKAAKRCPQFDCCSAEPNAVVDGSNECPRKFLYFIIHKPIEVLSDRIDSQTTLRVIDPKSAHFGERVTGIQPRETVYDVAARAGFPSSQVGLAGRLDYLTSGVMLMSNDSRMLNGVIRPPDERWEEGDGDGDGEGEEEEARRRKLFKYKTKVYEVRCFSSRLHELSDFVAIAAELSEPFVFSRQGQQHRTSRASVQVLRRWQAEEHSCGGRPELGWSVDLRVELKEGKHHQIRRMCARSKFVVVSLHRVQVASILRVESVPRPGQCRWLTPEEVRELAQGLGLGELGTCPAGCDHSREQRPHELQLLQQDNTCACIEDMPSSGSQLI